MSFDIRTANLDRLNSLTKYPSIPTYHALDPSNGNLLEQPTPFEGPVVLTEKIDGTNARIVCLPDGMYVIGSRGEFLLARGDLIGNPALGIVEALRPVADALCATHTRDTMLIFFGEVYGGKVTSASKQYTSARRVGFRLFDIAEISDYDALLRRPTQALSAWRENGGQTFWHEDALQEAAETHNLMLTPRLGEHAALPQDLGGAYALLQEVIPKTRSALDEGAGGQPEGIVARSHDRRTIAKLRFADYRRTFKRRR